jgi:uracil-DNA glycosylase family 4
LENPLSGLEECRSCFFHDELLKPLGAIPVKNPVTVMFIGENPSWQKELDCSLSPSSISGKALDDYYLKPLGLTRNEVWITNILKCRYPKTVYKNKSLYKDKIDEAAKTCAIKWLLEEIIHVKPAVIVTLSDREVYQRMRVIFTLKTPYSFSNAVGRQHYLDINGFQTILFPMIHPDISRPPGDGDNRKMNARLKWSQKHLYEHIPKLRKLLQAR